MIARIEAQSIPEASINLTMESSQELLSGLKGRTYRALGRLTEIQNITSENSPVLNDEELKVLLKTELTMLKHELFWVPNQVATVMDYSSRYLRDAGRESPPRTCKLWGDNPPWRA